MSKRGKKRQRSKDRPVSTKRPSGGGLFRKAVLAAGLLGLAYVLKRRRGEGGAGPSSGESRESARKERDIPIDDTTSEGSTEQVGEGEADKSTMGEDESALGDEASTEEIIERAEQDIKEEPAKPGEMTVDEEVVEDLAEEESEEGGTERQDDTEDEGTADTEDEESG